MLPEEAIERIRHKICCEKPIQHFCRDKCLYGVEACEFSLAAEALEKQIPKQVINGRCPSCYSDVVGSGYYCWSCGQALKWVKDKPWIAHEKDYE